MIIKSTNEAQIITLSFQIIEQINKELRNNNILNLNHLLLEMSKLLNKDVSISKDKLSDIVISEANKLLVQYSDTFRVMIDNEGYSSVYLFIIRYMKKVLKYYDDLMMTNQDKFDRYVEIINKQPKRKEILSENLFMTLEDIQNTMQLLNEAVRNYYEVYYNKSLFATFTDEQIIQFKIKESELAHLLGVNIKAIVRKPEYADLFHITPKEIEYINDTTYTLDPLGSAAVDVLHKIIDMKSGNLLQFEEDRLRKLENYEYKTMDYVDPFDTLMKYSKINMRSKTFINFKPLEELSLALNFPEGYKIIERSNQEGKQHSLLISKNNLSEKFKYSTLIANYDKNTDRRFFQSLFLKRPEEMEQLQKDATASITTSVELVDDDGSGGIRKDFSTLEQIQFLKEVMKDFNNLNLSDVVDYFHNLIDEYNDSNGKGMSI